jgi:acyl dehydratase
MASNGERAAELIGRSVGTTLGSGEWFEVDQERIDGFADVTEDHQFIHVDPKACKELSPWGVPIAHGFLTLSLLTKLVGSVPRDPAWLEGLAMGVNYGFDRVRFLSPVKVGSRIRASVEVKGVDQKDANTVQVTQSVTVEIEDEQKPALVADWVTRYVYG